MNANKSNQKPIRLFYILMQLDLYLHGTIFGLLCPFPFIRIYEEGICGYVVYSFKTNQTIRVFLCGLCVFGAGVVCILKHYSCMHKRHMPFDSYIIWKALGGWLFKLYIVYKLFYFIFGSVIFSASVVVA